MSEEGNHTTYSAEETTTSSSDNERQSGDSPSVLDILSQNQTELKYIVWIYTVAGVGFGLSAFLTISQLGGNSQGEAFIGAILALAILGFVLMSGILISLVIGFRLTTRLTGPTRSQYVTAFFGNMAGYLVMTTVTVILLSSSLSGGGGGGASETTSSVTNLGDLFFPLILLSIPVGLVAIGVMYLTEKQPSELGYET